MRNLISPARSGLPELYWQPTVNFNGRDAAISLIVVHDTEGGYNGAIATFTNSHSEVSAHIVLREDGLEATQMVAFESKAWHAVAFNSKSLGLEMAGFEKKGLQPQEWATEARIVAYLLHRFHIPPVWSHDGHASGFCRHLDLGKAGGGHCDPTMDVALWQRFVQQVTNAYDEANWPLTPWGK